MVSVEKSSFISFTSQEKIKGIRPSVVVGIGALDGIPLKTVAPSHGVIWTEYIDDIVQNYLDWSDFKPDRKLLIVYDTMWMSTEIMARAILDGATTKGVRGLLMKLSVNDLTDITTEVLDSAALVVGSPTLNKCMLPTVSSFLTYMKGLKPGNKFGAAFGSHGWGGGGAKEVDELLDKIGIEKMCDPITCKYRPEQEVLDKCYALGQAIGERINKI